MCGRVPSREESIMGSCQEQKRRVATIKREKTLVSVSVLEKKPEKVYSEKIGVRWIKAVKRQ